VTQAPDSGASPTSPPSSRTKLFIGMAMGFGVIIAVVIGLCVFWRCCCRMMSAQGSGKVAPANEDEEHPASAAADDDDEGL